MMYKKGSVEGLCKSLSFEYILLAVCLRLGTDRPEQMVCLHMSHNAASDQPLISNQPAVFRHIFRV